MPRELPFRPGALFLAPMQGITNRVVRRLFAERFPPDVLFTEHVRVRPGDAPARLSRADREDARADEHGLPLVVQLIGRELAPLVQAAREAQDEGAVHVNLNMGCPYGRMNVGCGGGLLQHPERLPALLHGLRAELSGTFSVKLRSGWDDPSQIFTLLPLFEQVGVDFLVLHARTVVQRYEGRADHALTARVVRATSLPVIANGDVTTAPFGRELLRATGAAGLMVGRGALRDPLLFARLRGEAPDEPSRAELRSAQQRYLRELARRYAAHFSGDAHVLAQLRSAIALMEEPDEPRAFKAAKKARTLAAFEDAVEGLA